MCVIIAKKPGQSIDHDIIEACHLANPDGFGVAWQKNGIVKRFKEVMTQAEVKDIINLIDKLKDKPALIHFRIKTHGLKCRDNCHPFAIGNGKIAMAHNGMFNSVSITHDEWSDTREVANKMNSWSEEIIRRSVKHLEEWHGDGNRTAILFPNGDIVTTGSWSTHKDLSFSNLHWKSKGCYQQDYKTTRHGTFKNNWTEDKSKAIEELKKSDGFLIAHDGKWVTKSELAAIRGEEAKKNQRARALIPTIPFIGGCQTSTALSKARSHVTSALNSQTQAAQTDSAQTASENTETNRQDTENGATECQSSFIHPKTTNPIHPLDSIDQVLIRIGDKSPGKMGFVEYYWDEKQQRVKAMVHRGPIDGVVNEWLGLGVPVTVIDGPVTRNIKKKRLSSDGKEKETKGNVGDYSDKEMYYVPE